MANSWRDFLGELSGYKPLYERAALELTGARATIAQLSDELTQAKDTIRRLELICPRPAPPLLGNITEQTSAWIQQQLDSMNLGIQRLALDATYYMTNQRGFLNVVAWDWTDTLPYIRERFDCENFAILFKAHADLHFHINQVAIIIDYQSGHGYNLVVYPDGNKQVLEPQSDALYVWTQRIEKFYSLKGAIALI
jgi:hypothetical protein